MKKLLALILSLVMVLALVACGGDTTDDVTDPGGETSTDDTGAGMTVDNLKVALILNGSITDASWNANGYNALKTNADELGFEITNYADKEQD